MERFNIITNIDEKLGSIKNDILKNGERTSYDRGDSIVTLGEWELYITNGQWYELRGPNFSPKDVTNL